MICSPVVEVRGLRERARTSLSFTLAGGENPAGEGRQWLDGKRQ
jgi:hypothetical protein